MTQRYTKACDVPNPTMSKIGLHMPCSLPYKHWEPHTDASGMFKWRGHYPHQILIESKQGPYRQS